MSGNGMLILFCSNLVVNPLEKTGLPGRRSVVSGTMGDDDKEKTFALNEVRKAWYIHEILGVAMFQDLFLLDVGRLIQLV